MPTYSKSERDIIEVLQNEINALKRAVKHLQNSHYISAHTFSKATPPNPLVEGMMFIATDDDFCWVKDNDIYSVTGTLV